MSKKIQNFINKPVVILKIIHNQEMLAGIFEETSKLGWGILDLNVTRRTIPPETNTIGALEVGFADDPQIVNLEKRGCPVIRIGTYPNPEKDKTIPAILPDLTEAGELAADHFADREFKNVAFVGNFPWAHEPILYNAFKKRALERGCNIYLLQTKTPKGKSGKQKIYDARVKQIYDWLKTLPKPIGIFTYHDVSAVTIYTTTIETGLNVPEEVALLGYGNSKFICDFLPVPLSSIDINFKERGRCAIKLLNHIVEGKEAPTEAIKVPVKGIVTRQSTNLLAVPDPVVAKALRFIWENYTEQISIQDVASACGVGKSSIARNFKLCLGRTIYTEIHRKRLELSCELLRSSMMTIAEIADSSGFPTPTYFHVAFRKAYGMTPGDFRKGNLPN